MGDAGVPSVVSFDPPQTYDVLDLDFRQELLGQAQVPAGEYAEIRLILAPNTGPEPANYYTLSSDPGTKIALKTPSAQQSGLKLKGHFTVEPDVINSIVLDFDPQQAIVVAGNSGKSLLKPTGIRILEVSDIWEQFGAIVGRIIPLGQTGGILPRISAYEPGATEPISSMDAYVAETTGDLWFRLFLPQGDYSLVVQHPTHLTFDSSLLEPPVLYEVSIGEETDAGDIKLLPEPGLAFYLEPADAWPEAQVDVLLLDGGTWTIVAEDAAVHQDDGLFAMALDPGTYALVITADGYVTFDSRSLLDEAGLYVVPEAPTTILDPITLVAQGTLSLILDPAAARESAEIDVIAETSSGPVTVIENAPIAEAYLDTGAFSALLDPGTYSLYVTAEGYDDLDTDVDLDPGTWTVEPGLDTDIGVLTLSESVPE
jgi:hypothetical protein